MRQIIEVLLFPPSGPAVLALVGAALWRVGGERVARLGKRLVAASIVLLLLASQPFVGAALLRAHQTLPALPPGGDLPKAGAIVVLAADILPHSPEYGGATVGELSLARLRYGAALARHSGLPLATSGGVLHWRTDPLSEIMAGVLNNEFGERVRWRETESMTTGGNAAGTAAILRDEGIDTILLVTHAWHMPRAKAAFERAGLQVVPAPTAFRDWPAFKWVSFVPSAGALKETRWALHEALGRAWYWLRRIPGGHDPVG